MRIESAGRMLSIVAGAAILVVSGCERARTTVPAAASNTPAHDLTTVDDDLPVSDADADAGAMTRTASHQPPPAPPTRVVEATRVIATFEDGLDGFGGTIERDVSSAAQGAASGRMTNTGQRWVTASRQFEDLYQDFRSVSFAIRSDSAKSIAVRLNDATGQSHQQRIPFTGDGSWQTIAITEFDGHQHWGGANDGRWHAPAKSIEFILEKGAIRGGSGSVWLDDLRTELEPALVGAEFVLGRMPPGNVFFDDDALYVPILTTGDRLTWEIIDYWQKTVASGQGIPEDGQVVIAPPRENGYFLVRATAWRGEDELKRGFVPFAVVPDHEVADRAHSPFGVMTHFAQGFQTDILPLVRAAGIVSIRDEHYWAGVEKKRGEYRYSDRSNEYMAAARDLDIEPLIAMTFENPLYDDGLTPYTPEGCAAYGRYGQSLLEQYGDQIKALEIWNEYNGSWCKGPAADDRPKYYVQMLKAAWEHIKSVRPDVKVLGTASVVIPVGYLEGVFRNGGLKYMDAVVLHPYRGRPEGVDEEIAEIEQMIRKYNDGKDVPFWITETGSHDTSTWDWEGDAELYEKGRHAIARYLVRQYTLLLTRNVERIYWYLLRDHMEFKSMGLLRAHDSPFGRYAAAPAYPAYATLIRQLDGARFVSREAWREYTRAYVELFDRRGTQVRVCWSTHPAKIELKADATLQVIDMMGVARSIAPERGVVVLELSEYPVYVVGEATGVRELVSGPQVIADSVDDYSKTQGRRGWSYGFYDGDGQGSGDGVPPTGAYTDDDFEQMEQVQTMWGYTWRGPHTYLTQGRGNAHPEIDGPRQIMAVRRWTSTVSGRVRITGRFNRGDKGDGTVGRVLVDGREVFSSTVGGPGAPDAVTFDRQVEVRTGSLVDMVVTPGPEGGNQHFDSTGIWMRVLSGE